MNKSLMKRTHAYEHWSSCGLVPGTASAVYEVVGQHSTDKS